MESTDMPEAGASARTMWSIPRPESIRSRISAACTEPGWGPRNRSRALLAGTGRANQTALRETFHAPSRARVRWSPQRPWDRPSITCSPRTAAHVELDPRLGVHAVGGEFAGHGAAVIDQLGGQPDSGRSGPEDLA